MQHFYDGQIRRYIAQMVRMMSGFKYKDANGKEVTVPTMYGDLSRQSGSIIRDNSENKLMNAPRISLYVSGLALDRPRTQNPTHVSKVNIRQRGEITNDNGDVIGYDETQGDSYTVERIMPTPYKLSCKADILTSNTDMKLQILEQILMLFNPSLEIQTTDNYVDWTSLSVVDLTDVNFSSRTIPVGTESELDIASLTFETPIWISPPTKVKRLGVITNIVMNVLDETGTLDTNFLGNTPLATEYVNDGNYGVLVYDNTVTLLKPTNIVEEDWDSGLSAGGDPVSWQQVLEAYPGKFKADISQIFIRKDNGAEVVGRLAEDPNDDTKLLVNWDADTYPEGTLISGTAAINRSNVDAVIDPSRYNPNPISGNPRYLILEDIGDTSNSDGPDAWKSTGGDDLYAHANDIIEWTGAEWEVIFDSTDETVQTPVYTTNLRTGVQYKWDGEIWSKSYEGEYPKGFWRIQF
jgi:hypothetical protein